MLHFLSISQYFSVFLQKEGKASLTSKLPHPGYPPPSSLLVLIPWKFGMEKTNKLPCLLAQVDSRFNSLANNNPIYQESDYNKSKDSMRPISIN